MNLTQFVAEWGLHLVPLIAIVWWLTAVLLDKLFDSPKGWRDVAIGLWPLTALPWLATLPARALVRWWRRRKDSPRCPVCAKTSYGDGTKGCSIECAATLVIQKIDSGRLVFRDGRYVDVEPPADSAPAMPPIPDFDVKPRSNVWPKLFEDSEPAMPPYGSKPSEDARLVRRDELDAVKLDVAGIEQHIAPLDAIIRDVVDFRDRLAALETRAGGGEVRGDESIVGWRIGSFYFEVTWSGGKSERLSGEELARRLEQHQILRSARALDEERRKA